MRIRSQAFRRFSWPIVVLVNAAVLFVIYRPNVGTWSHRLEVMAYVILFSIFGLGGLLLIFTRAGIVEFTYSDADKQKFDYKMSKRIAEREQHTRLGATFSKRYFESLDIEKRDSRD